MMKYIAYVMIFLIAFAAMLLGIIAATGNLAKIGKLLGVDDDKAAKTESSAGAPDISVWARELRARQEALNRREADLDAAEQENQIARQDLENLRVELQQKIDEFTKLIDTEDTKRQERLDAVAATFQEMKSTEIIIKELEEIANEGDFEDAKYILDSFEPRKKIKLLEAMEEKFRRKFLLSPLEDTYVKSLEETAN